MLLGGASGAIMIRFMAQNRQNILAGLESRAVGMGHAMAAQYFERYGDVQAMAINPSLRSKDRKQTIAALNAYVALYGIYDLIMVVNTQGELVAVNDKDPKGTPLEVNKLYGKNYRSAAWFKETVAGRFTSDASRGFDGTYVEDFLMDPVASSAFGEKRLGSTFSAQIKDEAGRLVGVITNRAGYRWLDVALKETYDGMRASGSRNVEILLTRKDGTLLYWVDMHGKSEWTRPDLNRLFSFKLAKAGNELYGLIQKGALSGGTEAPSELRNEKALGGYAVVEHSKLPASVDWVALVRGSPAEILASAHSAQQTFMIVFGAVLFIAIGVAWFASHLLARKLSQIAGKLQAISREVADASGEIAASSTEISEMTTEQAASIQVTAASIDEVSAMVKKSADNAQHSRQASDASRQAAERGQSAVKEMTAAVQEISRSNSAIMNQIEDSNRQIAAIVEVIGEIGSKTKIINDIVFQTRLLSFNASVEAARAGEHGKGFAVVAEEVGHLAQMSGAAAKEISGMLDSSLSRVTGIVNETREKVQRLIDDGKSKLDQGLKVTEQCSEALLGILSSVQEVDSMVGEISSASHEQSQGVSEINKANNQLDQATQSSSRVAQKGATSSEQLRRQAQEMKQAVQSLLAVVHGSAERERPSATPPSPTDLNNVVAFRPRASAEVTASTASGGSSVEPERFPSARSAAFESSQS